MCDSNRIRRLNDAFRKTMVGGKVVATSAIASRGDLPEIIRKLQRYDAFDEGNDPYGEHDFGQIVQGKDIILWKIDYYGLDLMEGSPNPADASATVRVLTLMLAEEY